MAEELKAGGDGKKAVGDEVLCNFCRRPEKYPVYEGDAAFYDDGKLRAHHLCLLFSSGLEQKGEEEEGFNGFLAADVKKELGRISRLKCAHCKRAGGGIGCAVSKCKRTFHYPCALEAEALLQYKGNYRCFCLEHRRRMRFFDEFFKDPCPVCLEPFDVVRLKNESVVWTAKDEFSVVKLKCCKKALMHRSCALQQALHAGYLLKCPLCNNNSKDSRKRFASSLRLQGIFVPKRDSSWEQDPDAFAEHLERPNQCSIEECLFAGNGSSARPEPELVLCDTCGSVAAHLICARVDSGRWLCGVCDAVERGQRSLTPKSVPGSAALQLRRHLEALRMNAGGSGGEGDTDAAGPPPSKRPRSDACASSSRCDAVGKGGVQDKTRPTFFEAVQKLFSGTLDYLPPWDAPESCRFAPVLDE